MQRLAILLVVAACGGDGGNGGDDDTTGDPDAPPAHPDAVPDARAATWSETVDDYIDTACVEIEACMPPIDNCVQEFTADFADATAALDDSGEQQCIPCLAAKIDLMRAYIANGCSGTGVDVTPIFAACDLDPNADYDGDGVAGNDHDEACAGYP
jgi:hypothetical protein